MRNPSRGSRGAILFLRNKLGITSKELNASNIS